jgi:exosortase A
MTLMPGIHSVLFHPSLKWLLIAAALLAPFLFYVDTAQSIVSIWNSSETFAHGYIILPISLWLIWRRREIFSEMPPTPFWPALLLLLACGFAWLLAELGGVQVVRQYAFVAMIPLAALAMLGLRISLALAFPLVFLLFAVPFGEIFIDPLINITADFTVAALHLTGIPVLREGNNFSIPSGSWSVVEACSGVRYLIASLTLGSLYAYLTYRSHLRRLLFILLAIIVPILANGLRAYMIVMIGHLSGMKLAVGVDHLIYGWAFFGLVMFLMFWLGSYWREDLQTLPAKNLAHKQIAPQARQTSPARLFTIAFGTIVGIAIWPSYANYIEKTSFNPAPAKLNSFESSWQEAPPFTKWSPYYSPGNAELHRFYQRDQQKVGIAVNYYRNQHQGSELISSANRLVLNEDPIWNRVSISVRDETALNRTLSVRETRISGASGAFVVWHWYWINGNATVSDYAGKLLQAKSKLLMQGDDGVSMMVFAPYAEQPDEARSILRGFLADNLVALETTLASNIQ